MQASKVEDVEISLPVLSGGICKLLEAKHHDPFEELGLQKVGSRWVLRLLRPHVSSAFVLAGPERLPMSRIEGTDLFELSLFEPLAFGDYQYEVQTAEGHAETFHDPYRLAPMLSDEDIYLFNSGENCQAYLFLGAHKRQAYGVDGVLFSVWAPNAERVSVVGDFNRWDGRTHAMRSRGGSGIWELFIPDLSHGQPYKFEIRNRYDGSIQLKMDPYARQTECRPNTASIIPLCKAHDWCDQVWMDKRAGFDWAHEPISIYEVHLGSWQLDHDGSFLNYRQLAERLAAYLQDMHYTHVQLMPISEHPFDGSWGYQVTGYFSPTSRFGSPEDFAFFVDYMHQQGFGVFVDWVPAHFPKDAHALGRFDGSALYEHEDPLLGEHKDWGTLIFNYGRKEVQSFLISSAIYWLEEFHIDGLRVDAVASMLYLDYSREAGEWRPNKYGGNENLEAVEFIKKLNETVHERHPGALMMAEESTSWPRVSHPTYLGGLGFTMKWNMGWMNDSLEYMSLDPVYRQFHHDKLTFALLYAFSENFILPLSHDEVVHLKKSLLGKMPGDQWQQFANLRLLYAYMYTQPGKKLLFMGGDIGQYDEWDHDRSVQWDLLKFPYHKGLQNLVRDLNKLYKEEAALHRFDFDQVGFEWIDCHDSHQSVLSYRRQSEHEALQVLINFTPVPRHDYRVGVSEPGYYREMLNSDAEIYGGSNLGNAGGVDSEDIAWGGHSHSISIALPPLGVIVLKKEGSR